MKIIFVLAFSLFIRLIFLNVYPNGLTNDELHFVLNAKAVYLNFSNLAENWSPLSLKTIPGEPSSELTFLTLGPFIGPFPLNLFTARLPYVLFGVASIYLLFLITSQLFNPKIGYLTALIASINPWLFFVNRTSFDAPIAIFFFLLTLYCLLKLKGNLLFFSLIPSVFAFYTYIGTKVIYVPAIVLFCLFTAKFRRKYFSQYFIISLLSLFLFIFYIFSLKNNGGLIRTTELWSPFSQNIILQVENERQLSVKSIFTPIFINRYTVYFRLFISKYLNNFSPDVLFLKGDPTYLISLWRHGYFYLTDIILFILGSFFLFTKYRLRLYFLIGLILLSPIPEAVRSDSIPAYAFHSSFQYPFLLIIVASGFYFLLSSIKNKIIKYLIVIFQILLFLNLTFVYFFSYPIYQPEGFFFSNRLISQFINFEQQNSTHSIVFLTREPTNMFRNFIFFSNALNKSTFKNIQQSSLNKDSIRYQNILFTNKLDTIDFSTTTLIIENALTNRNYPNVTSYSLNRLSDNQPMFSIFNSNLCSDQQSSKFPRTYNFSLFTPDKMSLPVFCKNFVSLN